MTFIVTLVLAMLAIAGLIAIRRAMRGRIRPHGEPELCSKCGQALTVRAAFCGHCGNSTS